MSSFVPDGWSLKTISEVCNIAIGGTPSRSVAEYWDTEKTSDNLWVSIRDLNKSWIYETSEHITDLGVKSSNVKPVKKGTVLMSFKLSVGRVAYAGKDLYTNEAIVAFLPKSKDLLSNQYLYQGLQQWNLLENIDQAVKGITLNKEKINQIEALLPPLPEQQKIATILSSVDDVIEKTRAQIDKLKDLKTGMMQELLTKGIGHTEFKDSPVGRIPAAWDSTTLESLFSKLQYSMRSGPFGSALLKHELVEDGIPYLGIDNVHVERFQKKYRRFVTDEKFQELSRYAVREDDVMVTIMGTVGRCCMVPKGIGKALSSKHVWTMTFDQEKYIPELICWQINYATWVEDQFKNESQGGVMESISSKTLRSLLVPLPPLEEQKKIAQAHSKTSKPISVKTEKLASLMILKKALMQDLLTGKVRVNLIDKESAVV